MKLDITDIPQVVYQSIGHEVYWADRARSDSHCNSVSGSRQYIWPKSYTLAVSNCENDTIITSCEVQIVCIYIYIPSTATGEEASWPHPKVDKSVRGTTAVAASSMTLLLIEKREIGWLTGELVRLRVLTISGCGATAK